jgi:hypothetical protein
MDDAARLSRMSQFNIDLVKERFFSKKRYKLVAIDHETAVFNRCLPAKANVFDVKEIEIQPHGSMIYHLLPGVTTAQLAAVAPR